MGGLAPLVAQGAEVAATSVQPFAGLYAFNEPETTSGPSWIHWGLGSAAVALIVLGAVLLWQERFRRGQKHSLMQREDAEQKRTEQALAESEARFHAFMDHSPLVAFIKDAAGRYIYGNQAWAAQFGKKPADLLGRTDFDLWPEETARLFRDSDAKTLAAGRVTEGVEMSLMADGSVRHWMVLKFPIRESSGRQLLGGAVVDITLQKQVDATLRASEEKLRRHQELLTATFAASREGIVVEENGQILYANQAYASVHGYADPEELVGRPLSAVQSHEDAVRMLEYGRQRLRGEAAPTLYEFKGLHRDGSLLDLEASVSTCQIGETTVIVTVVRDIRERKKAEEALRQSEQRYRQLVESARDAIFSLSLDGKLTSLNHAFETITGWARSEWLGKPFTDLVHPEDIPFTRDLLDRSLRGEQPPIFEVRLIRKSGETVTTEYTTTPRMEDGQVVGILGIAREITSRRRLEEQFHQAQKMEAIGHLAGGVAHDFNNLLTVITGYCDLLLEDESGFHDIAALNEIQRASQRATSLTRQLLAFGRKQILAPIVLDLNAVVRGMDTLLCRLIGEDITLATRLEAGMRPVKADQGQIEQVLMNLAVNSRDAMPVGGKITIETATVIIDAGSARHDAGVRPGEYVRVAVSDTGCGMDERVKAHLFEPFFTTKEVGKGTGLGLATAHGIIQQSGGHVLVHSEVGQGTTFEIFLPCIQEATVGREIQEPLGSLPPGSETVLLVEDEDAVRDIVRRLLSSDGYKVLEARHGREGLRVCEQYVDTIHLLITDVVMPEMGGRELAEQIALLRPAMKFLYMSGYTDDALVRQGVRSEGAAFLQKPFSLDMLARKVREVLDR